MLVLTYSPERCRTERNDRNVDRRKVTLHRQKIRSSAAVVRAPLPKTHQQPSAGNCPHMHDLADDHLLANIIDVRSAMPLSVRATFAYALHFRPIPQPSKSKTRESIKPGVIFYNDIWSTLDWRKSKNSDRQKTDATAGISCTANEVSFLLTRQHLYLGQKPFGQCSSSTHSQRTTFFSILSLSLVTGLHLQVMQPPNLPLTAAHLPRPVLTPLQYTCYIQLPFSHYFCLFAVWNTQTHLTITLPQHGATTADSKKVVAREG